MEHAERSSHVAVGNDDFPRLERRPNKFMCVLEPIGHMQYLHRDQVNSIVTSLTSKPPEH